MRLNVTKHINTDSFPVDIFFIYKFNTYVYLKNKTRDTMTFILKYLSGNPVCKSDQSNSCLRVNESDQPGTFKWTNNSLKLIAGSFLVFFREIQMLL